MAYEESLRSITLTADATVGIYTGVPGTRDVEGGPAVDYTGKQYCFVGVTGDHQCGLAGPTDVGIGVLQNKPQGVGHAATVGFHGVSKVVAGAAVAAGDLVYSDANGNATTDDATATALQRGVALQSAAGAGELIAVLLAG